MGHLPAEIMAKIISYFVAESSRQGHGDNSSDDIKPLALAPYATVSREWQQHVEFMTFAHINLNPARLASPLAAQALTPDRIRRFVRSIGINVLLPPYDEQARERLEDEAARAKNDGVFTEVVRRVFELLAGGQGGQQQQQQKQRAGVDTDYRPRIQLSLTVCCVSDAEDIEARKLERDLGRGSDMLEGRYESSYLDLKPAAGKSVEEEAEALPELYCIKGFRVHSTLHFGRLDFTRRYFAPRAFCLMASRMQGLESIHWILYDNERRDIALRKKLRADFADALHALPSSLRDFNLSYSKSIPLDHSFQTPSILDETDGNDHDKLSLALHKLSQRLVTFSLSANVGPEVLWPLERHGTQDDDPLWPRMRDYFVDPGAIAPSGQWRFQRPDDESDYESESDSSDLDPLVLPGDETEDPFRTQLSRDAVDPLLLAAARAVRRMPALRRMHFTVGPPPGAMRLQVKYMVEGGDSRGGGGGGGGDGGAAELIVHCSPVFHPDEEVLQIWREAAEEHAGVNSGLVVVVKDPRDRR